MTYGGHLLDQCVLFAHYLRALGLPVSSRQLTALVDGLTLLDLGNRSEFQAGAQAILVHRRDQVAPFQQAFQRFWLRQPGLLSQELPGSSPVPDRQAGRQAFMSLMPTIESPEPTQEDKWAHDRSATYSVREILRAKDFGQLSSEETAEVRHLIVSTDWELPQKRSRRTLMDSRGHRPDLRKAWRHSLRHGGEVLALRYRRPRHKPSPLVALCDISGSMERYARVLMQFLYALCNQHQAPIEAFVFGTRLTRLTRQLRQGNVERALNQATGAIQDWGGGTRIGQALRDFNTRWARRVLRQGATVLIISDGFDRGDIDLLGREMAHLQRCCRRLIWLNPLLGSPDYRPLVRGMQVALPYVDHFLPVHNLASLEQLVQILRETYHARTSPRYRTLAR